MRERNERNDREIGLSIQAVVPESVSGDQVVEKLIGLFHALNEYHIASGGNGLTVEDFQTFIREGVLVGVGP